MNSTRRHHLADAPRHLKPIRPSGGDGGLGEAGLVWQSWAKFRGRFKMEIGFQISNKFEFWQDFVKFYKEFGHGDFS
jgi:hypothetical protein